MHEIKEKKKKLDAHCYVVKSFNARSKVLNHNLT